MYHRFAAEPTDRRLASADFERQMSFLREQDYNVLSLSRLVAALRAGEDTPRAVVVTVDDGYEDFHTYALPVLRRYAIPATIFVTNDFIAQSIWLWPDMIEYALMNSRHPQVRLGREGREMSLDIGSKAAARRSWSTIGDHLMQLTDAERRAAIAALCVQLEIELPARPTEEYRAMNWEQVRECQQAGIDIGAHTRTHPILTSMPEREAEAEISTSKADLETQLGVPCHSFAYPNGTPIDYNAAIKAMVQRAGFSNATVAFHDGTRRQDLYELRRFPATTNFERFRRALCGAEQLTLEIKNRFNGHQSE